jgi:amidohydrolase
MIQQKIQALAQQFLPEVIALRRKIHQFPELAYQEVATSELVAETLISLGFIVQKNIARTGVVGIFEGKNPSKKCIALRADMDALPIEEKNEHSFVSTHTGKMHACGHDVHTANLLGVAMVLSNLKNEFDGTIKFIFQPSEEKIPSGAAAMIAEGVLQNPTPVAILGAHVSPELPVGTIGIKAGEFMASADELYIKVIGKGGHAARSAEINNPLFIAAKLLLAYQQLGNADTSVILSFGKIEGKGATNVVPEEVMIEGTLRCFDEKKRVDLHHKIKDLAHTIALENNANIVAEILVGYPVLINDKALTNEVQTQFMDYLSPDKIITIPKRMGSEDFAYYSQVLPACFIRLGTSNAHPDTQHGLHSPYFDVDENVFATSVGAMSFVALQLLQ